MSESAVFAQQVVESLLTKIDTELQLEPPERAVLYAIFAAARGRVQVAEVRDSATFFTDEFKDAFTPGEVAAEAFTAVSAATLAMIVR